MDRDVKKGEIRGDLKHVSTVLDELTYRRIIILAEFQNSNLRALTAQIIKEYAEKNWKNAKDFLA